MPRPASSPAARLTVPNQAIELASREARQSLERVRKILLPLPTRAGGMHMRWDAGQTGS